MKIKRRFILFSLCTVIVCAVLAVLSANVFSFNTDDISEKKNPVLLASSLSADTGEILNSVNQMSSVISDKQTNAVFGKTYTSFLSSSTLADVYNFTVNQRGTVTLTFKNTKSADLSSWYIRFYNEYFLNGIDGETSYRLLNVVQANSSDEETVSVEIGVMPGNYRVVITSGDIFSAATYKISAQFNPRTDFEVEYNDTPTRYTEIYADVPMIGTASYFTDTTDADYYMLRVYYPSYIDISFEHPASDLVSVCWRVNLIDINGNELYAESSIFSQEKIQSGQIGLDEGIYFISVVNHVYSDEQYTLTVTKDSSLNFETEPNDTKNEADEIDFSTPIYGATSNRIGKTDKDWFKVTLEADGYINLDFRHTVTDSENSYNTWKISLYTAEQKLVYCKNIQFNAESVVSPAIGLAKGTYYILVDNSDMYAVNDTYCVEVSYVENAYWEKEYNNTYETATPLSKGSAINATLIENGTDYDADFYKITLSETQDIFINLSHKVSSSNKECFVFTLYDENMKPVAPCDENGKYYYSSLGELIYSVSNTLDKAQTKAYYNSLKAGNYYVKVSVGLYYSNIVYNLIIG